MFYDSHAPLPSCHKFNTMLSLSDGGTMVISNDVAGVGLRAFILDRGIAAAPRK